MRLFRQPKPDDWQSVFEHIARALREHVFGSNIRKNAGGRTQTRCASKVLPLTQDVSETVPAPTMGQATPGEGVAPPLRQGWNGTSIKLMCPINHLGYGVAGWNILKALVNLGYEVAAWPLGGIDLAQEDRALLDRAVSRQQRCDAGAPSVRISHQDNLDEHVGRPRVGFPIFELTRFTESELRSLRGQDALLVASSWAKSIVVDNQVLPPEAIHVVPLGVDREVFHERDDGPTPTRGASKDTIPTRSASKDPPGDGGTPRGSASKAPPILHDGPTVFLNIGKWERRKGHDVLLEAFQQAFGPDDHVVLWMMAFNPVIHHDPKIIRAKNDEWERRYRDSPLGSKITILPRLSTQREVAAVMRRADCGVFPSRAEGWNLPALEVLSCGKQLIITNYSAHTEYADPHNSRLIEIDELEDAFDHRWFFGQGRWASFDKRAQEQLVEHLHAVHRETQEHCHARLNAAGIETAKRFSWDATARHLGDALRKICR
jgi:hypothetical protein